MTTSALPDWHRRWLDLARMVHHRQVFFIVGCQKSGTTWVQKLLNAHPQVACHGESHFCDTLAKLLPAFMKKYNDLQSETGRIEPALLLSTDDLQSTMKVLFDRLLARYIEITDGNVDAIVAVGDKTPEHANAMPFLRGMYPTCRFIHVIRDGRDAAVSGWAHLQRQNKTGRFSNLAEYVDYFAQRHWLPYVTNARTCGAPLGGDYLEVRYEDLHEHPMRTTTALLTLLGVESDEQTVQRCVDEASFSSLSGGRSVGEEDRGSHFRKGVVGDWTNHFDDEAARRFNNSAGDLLRELDYAIHEHAAPIAG